MTNRNVLILSSALTGLALVLAVTLAPRGRDGGGAPPRAALSSPSPVALPRGVTLSLREGAARAYRWSLATIVSPVSPGALPAGDTSFSGTLNVRVVPGALHRTLAVQVAPLHVRVMGQPNSRMERAFSTPFLIEIDGDGRFGATSFPPGLALADRVALDAAIRSLEIVLPPAPAERWEATETDQNGEYVASYEAVTPTGEIVKRKVRYVSRQGNPFSAAVEESTVRAQLDPDGTWLARAEGHERIAFGVNEAQVLVRVEGRFQLEPLPHPPSADLPFWRDEALASARVTVTDPSADAPSAWEEEEQVRARAQFRRDRVTLNGLVSALAGGAEDAALPRRIAMYLRAFPDETWTLPLKLRRLHDPASARLLGALQVAGTPQAQAALADVSESKAQPQANRLRALFALAAVERPALEVIERVARAAGRPGGRAERSELGSTALLVLGTLAQKAPDELRSRITRQLEDGLHTATGPREERLFLLALGNAHATLASNTLHAYLRSSNAGVREAATALTANGAGEDAVGELIALLAREEDARVREAVVQGLLRRPPDARANEAIARALAEGREPEPRVRTQMAGYLARQMKEFPENRMVLEAQLKRETNRDAAVAVLNSLVP